MDTRYRGLLFALGAFLLIVLILPIMGWSMTGGSWGMMGPGMMSGYTTGSTAAASGWSGAAAMLLGGLTMVAFGSALVVGAVLLVRWLGAERAASGTTGTSGAADIAGIVGEEPLATLRRRYAAGEITDEQFAHMRRTLAA